MYREHTLSFVRNPDPVIEFISLLEQQFVARQPVWVVLQNVKQIDYDGITVLLSVVVRFKSQQIAFNGDFPKLEKVRKIITKSGFFKHLFQNSFSDESSYSLTSKSSIFTHAMRTVDAELGEKLIESASETVWGEKRRCTGIQRTFIELMQNTNNHASLDKEGDRLWWLSIKHVKEDHRVAFSFVDYGVGVFYSLRHKPRENKFYHMIERLFDIFALSSDAQALELIFKGELHRTASQKYFRGKGLPGIYEALKKNALSNFTLITNNVMYSSSSDEYRMLQNDFHGTFVYWELNQANASLPS